MSFNGPILRVENLVKHFPVTAGVMSKVVDQVKAVDGVSFELQRGETLGLVGESGCGKTTLGRSILRLIAPTSGEIHFEGAELTKLPHRQMQPCRRDMQIIFQDPFSSLNPRMTVLDIVGEALRIHGVAKAKETEAIVHDLLRKVGLPGAWINRYPHEFSGGQRQRIGIARAIALNPKLIVCDEPVSALDVSVQAQVLNLLIKLREEMNLSYLFIAHNLAVVKHISNRVAVMYLGQIVETAASERLFEEAAHPYTLALLSAIPEPDPDRRVSRIRLEGDVPTPLNPPPGCRFHTRCPAVMERCRKEEPNSIQLGEGHEVKCFLAHDVAMGEGWRGQVMARMNEAIEENRANGATGQKPPASDSPAPDQPLEEPEEPDDAFRRVVIEEDRSLPQVVGAIGVAIGCATVLYGSLVLGILIGAIAHFLLVMPGAKRKAVPTLAALILLALCFYGRGPVGETRNMQRAEEQFIGLNDQIARYRETTGTYPVELSEMDWRLIGLFPNGKPRDPWGNLWKYSLKAGAEEREAFQLGSYGPDGQPGGGDDVGFISPAEVPAEE